MRIKFTTITCLLILIIFSISSPVLAQYSIGVASGVVNLGTYEKNSKNIVSFYLVTSSDEPFLVSLEKESETLDFFSRSGYGDYLSNYSEEDIMDWIEFLTNPVELESINKTESGGIVGGKKEVNFIVNVPEDAEPGYHIFKIKPIPVAPSENLGHVGAIVVGITTVSFLFNVEGDAVRDGIILDVVYGGKSGNMHVINTYFQNIGTVSITARATQSVYKNGNFVVDSFSAKELVKPGGIKVFKNFLPEDKITEGNYEVRTTVNFITDYAYKNSTINITPIISPPGELAKEKPKVSLWIVVLLFVITIIAIIIYKW